MPLLVTRGGGGPTPPCLLNLVRTCVWAWDLAHVKIRLPSSTATVRAKGQKAKRGAPNYLLGPGRRGEEKGRSTMGCAHTSPTQVSLSLAQSALFCSSSTAAALECACDDSQAHHPIIPAPRCRPRATECRQYTSEILWSLDTARARKWSPLEGIHG